MSGVDVLAVMNRDAIHARRHRIANQDEFDLDARVGCSDQSVLASAAVAELIRAAEDISTNGIGTSSARRLRAALANVQGGAA